MKEVPKEVIKLVITTSYISISGSHSMNMTSKTNLDENIEASDNFKAWKYRIMLILEEHDLEGYIKEDVQEPKGNEEKSKHKRIWSRIRGSFKTTYTMKRELDIVLVFLSPNFSSYFYPRFKNG